MRKTLFLFAFITVAGLFGTASKEAAAQCTHLGSQGTCPPNVSNKATSLSFNADGSINWSDGSISGPCCASPSGIETGAGLLNLNNELGGGTPYFGPSTSGLTPEPGNVPLNGDSVFEIFGGGFLDTDQNPVCDFNGCSGSGLPGEVFGANPNSGYLCDTGGPGCGNDIWVGLPQPGFGECGPGGCSGASPITPIDFKKLPGTGPYAQNRTTGQVDPFGGAGSFFMDPVTGDITDLPKDRNKWPKRIKLADRLNDAFVNGEIGYPFGDPKWDQRSVQYYKDNPIAAPVEPLNVPLAVVPSTNFYQTEDRGATPTVFVPPVLPQVFVSPYQQNRTIGGNIDPFGGGGNVFVDPRTGKSTELPKKEADWPEKFKKAEQLNGLYVSGHIKYPFKDPNWETKPPSAFAVKSGSGVPSSPSVIIRGGGRRGLGIGAEPPLVGTVPVIVDTVPVHRVVAGDNLFRLALRYGVPIATIAQANGISADTPLAAGQVLTVPTSTPAPVIPSETSRTGDTPSTGGNPRFGGKSGRFGIGADTSLGGVNGLSARFQVAKSFGIQAIVAFAPVGLESKNENADLTNYVSAAVANTVTTVDAARSASTPPQVAPQPPKPTYTKLQTEVFGNSRAPGVYQVDREGEETTFQVSFQGQVGPNGTPRTAEFGSRPAAIRFTNMIKFEGLSFEEAVAAMPDDMKPIPRGTPATDVTDTLLGNIPKEFQAPVLRDRWDGEIHDIDITDPKTGQRRSFETRQQAETALDAMRNGATLDKAAEIARNAPVVTPDGLASATSSSSPKTTRSTPAPAGSAPTFTNNRPAIIIRTDDRTTTPPTSAGTINDDSQPTTVAPAPTGSAPSSVNNRPAIIVPPTPTRPEGTSAGTMKGLLNGNAYDIEVIRTADGKILAVGTGENAGHVFGEVKETSNKLFGDWRREGPWTPPPAKTPASTQAGQDQFNAGDKIEVKIDTPNVEPSGNTADSGDDVPPDPSITAGQNNLRVRSQIANSDRDYMTQKFFTDGFESRDQQAWTSTGR